MEKNKKNWDGKLRMKRGIKGALFALALSVTVPLIMYILSKITGRYFDILLLLLAPMVLLIYLLGMPWNYLFDLIFLGSGGVITDVMYGPFLMALSIIINGFLIGYLLPPKKFSENNGEGI